MDVSQAIRRKKNFPEKKKFSTLKKNILVNIGPNFMQQNTKACKKLFRIWLWGLFNKTENISGFGQSIYMYFFSCDLKVNFEKLCFNLNSFLINLWSVYLIFFEINCWIFMFGILIYKLYILSSCFIINIKKLFFFNF